MAASFWHVFVLNSIRKAHVHISCVSNISHCFSIFFEKKSGHSQKTPAKQAYFFKRFLQRSNFSNQGLKPYNQQQTMSKPTNEPKNASSDPKEPKIDIINMIGLKDILRKGTPCGIYLNVLFKHAFYGTNFMCYMPILLKESMRF